MSKIRFIMLLVAFGSAVFFWRRKNRSRGRVDLYYADGSMITLAPEAPNAAELFSLAGEILSGTKPS